MNAIELLHNRVSAPVLNSPAPTQTQLEIMFRAALRAPDHAGLQPWRFLTIEQEARSELGQLFAKALQAKTSDISEEKLLKAAKKPLRAPMVIIAIASITEHPKVPEVEQVITAGCAAHSLLLAAYAQGLGAMWRTGEMAFDPTVKAGLGLKAHEQVVGFLYVGTAKRMRQIKALPLEGVYASWDGINNV